MPLKLEIDESVSRKRNGLTWVVQNNLGKSDDVTRMAVACARLGVGCLPVRVIPFDPTPPDISLPGPVIFYGATGFVNTAHASGRWEPCAFFDEGSFNYNAWSKEYPVLNPDAEVTTIAEFGSRDIDPGADFFIRPVRDLKEFAGEVVSFGDFSAWYKRISHNEYTVKSWCEIMVSEPKAIETEWRLFIVGGKVVAGSQYVYNRRLDISSDYPPLVDLFGASMAAMWQPADVFVLDVCSVPGRGPLIDRLRVVEINCFNSTGFYAADIDLIVEYVSDHVCS